MDAKEGKPSAPASPPPKGEEAAAREARLAQALRANLRRRKAAGRPAGKGPAKG